MAISAIETCSTLSESVSSQTTLSVIFLTLFLVFLAFDTGVSWYGIFKAVSISISPPLGEENSQLVQTGVRVAPANAGSIRFNLKG